MKRHHSEFRSRRSLQCKRRNSTVPYSNVKNILDIECDYLTDRTVVFEGTNTIRNVVAVELAESSDYFKAVMKYHDHHKPICLPHFLCSIFPMILQYLRRGVMEFCKENALDVFIASDFLLMDRLKATAEIQLNRLSEDLNFAIRLWRYTDGFNWPELAPNKFAKILANFQQLIKCEEYVNLTLDELMSVLNHNQLNIQCESEVVEAAFIWCRHNWKERSQHMVHVLDATRIGTMFWSGRKALKERLLQNGIKWDLLDNWDELQLSNDEHYFQYREPHEAVFVYGGWCANSGPKNSVQIYNRNADQWTLWPRPSDEIDGSSSNIQSNLGEIPKRVYAGCIFYNTCVYVIGGYDGHAPLKTTLCYDFALNRGWTELSCMYEKRYYVSVAQLNGTIYACGGHNGEIRGRLNTAEMYVVKENFWQMIAPMNNVRSDASAATLRNRIYVCGGFDGRNYHQSAECYNPANQQWTLIGSMNFSRGGISVVAHNKYIYAFGGNDGNARLSSIERYDIHSDSWTVIGQMQQQKSNLSTVVMQNYIYIVGGWSDEPNSGILNTMERFNLETYQCEFRRPMKFSASATCACTISGRQLIQQHVQHQRQPLLPTASMELDYESITDQTDGQTDNGLMDI